jgi:hypothetical protein
VDDDTMRPQDAPQPVSVPTRRGTTAQWLNSGLILRKGEGGRDLDTGVFKYGDGIHTWPELPVAYATLAQIEKAMGDLGLGGVDLPEDDWPDLTVLAEVAMT